MELVPSRPDFVRLEQKILDFWKRTDAFAKLQKQVEGRPLFRFVDGPITANNPMGVHHAWGRALKDAFIRYKVMRGHSCRFQNGFDCQGLWVEVEVEKELGFKGKPDIEAFGIDRFSQACKERIETFARVIVDQSIRLGQWMDWENSYYTHRDGNIVGIWHFLKTCAEKGWLYDKDLSMPWCPRCGTSLSEHEMAGSYKEVEHTSLFVRVPLLEDRSRNLLLWSTTPWTLPANVAAAVNPELNYVEVKSPRWDYTLILAEPTLPVLEGEKVAVVRTFKGAELVGLRYETFFPELATQPTIEHRVVAWSDVAWTEGSGIVHIAPGCGREDHELGLREGLAIVSPVDESGRFFPNFGPYAGRAAGEVAQDITADLERRGKLFRAQPVTHSYPVCWRCKHELIFRLVREWFLDCDAVRGALQEAARTVKWQPDFMGKRMHDWLHNMGDWCISRKRYWGLPLPFYPCTACGHLEVVGSREELRALAVDPAVLDALPELHRPWIDDVRIRCPKCSKEVARVAEVGDCWLDAGIVPYTTLGYYDDRAAWEKAYPAEWICEMREQVRLWFYSMLFMGVVISGRAPYEEVLAYERVISEEGTRFSKTGFMIRFDEAVEKMGADPMRYLYCSQPPGAELRFGYAGGEAAARKLVEFWNVYTFFVTYAVIDKPSGTVPVQCGTLGTADRWLLARTAALVDAVTAAYDGYNTPVVIRELERFADDLSNWYVRLNRRRFWRAGHRQDKEVCYGVLFGCLRATALVMAPIVPFLSEEIWQNAVRSLDPKAPESIHHASWPEIPAAWRDEDLLRRTEVVREVVSLAQNLRAVAKTRVRQPLPAVYVLAEGEVRVGSDVFTAEEARDAVAEQAALVAAELNVKDVQVVTDAGAFRRPRLQLDLRKAGPVLKADLSLVKAELEAIDGPHMDGLVAQVARGEAVAVGHWSDLPAAIFERAEKPRPGVLQTVQGGLVVAVDTNLSDELVVEGLVRDLVRHLQVLRKNAGLEVSDRVSVGLAITSPELRAAVEKHRAYVMEEVLAVELVESALADATGQSEFDVQGHGVRATVRRHQPSEVAAG